MKLEDVQQIMRHLDDVAAFLREAVPDRRDEVDLLIEEGRAVKEVLHRQPLG